MKYIFTILTLFLAVSLFAQNKSQFKVTQIDNINKTKPKVSFDTASYQSKIDLAVYQKKFGIPPAFPKYFIDPIHKNDSITEWATEDSVGCAFIYVSDNLGRVVKYGYISSENSKKKPFLWYILYEEMNRPVRMECRKPVCLQTITNDDGKKYNRITQSTSGGEYEFLYNEKGDIVQILYFYQGKLETQIERVKK